MSLREHRNPEVRKRRYRPTFETRVARMTSFERRTKHKHDRLTTKHEIRMEQYA